MSVRHADSHGVTTRGSSRSMVRRGRRNDRRGASSRSSGFTLIEVAVTIGIASIVIVPLMDVMYGALSAGRTDQALANATNVATQQLEQVHAIPYASVGFYGSQTDYTSTWEGQSTVELATSVPSGTTPAMTPVTTTTLHGVDYTIETFVTYQTAAVPTGSSTPTPTVTDPQAYKEVTVLVCWVPGQPGSSLSSCTSSFNSVVPATGQSTVQQQTLLYPGGQGPYAGTTTSTSSTTTTTSSTPPPTPTGLTATSPSAGGDTEVDLSWTPGTGAGPQVEYQVQWVAQTSGTCTFTGYSQSSVMSGTSYSVTGLSPSQAYCFQVLAYDPNSGLWSSPSGSVTKTTQSSSGTTTTTSAGTTTTTSGGTTTTTSGGTTTTTAATTTTSAATTTTVAPCTPVSFTVAPSWSSIWTTKVYLDNSGKLQGPLSLTVNLTGACSASVSAKITSGPSPEVGWTYSLANSSGHVWTGSASSQNSNGKWDAGTYYFSIYENGAAVTPAFTQNLLVCSNTATTSGSPNSC